MNLDRRQVFFRGHVQGVGFRMTTRRLAAGRDVAGYVRNLDDGRVELVVDGPAAEIDRLLDAIRQAFGPKIHDVSSAEVSRAEPFEGFSIR